MQNKEKFKADYFIVGLGNYKKKYKNTYHNVGCLVIEELLQRHNANKETKTISTKDAKIHNILIKNTKVSLFTLKTFMNLSGEFVKTLVEKYEIDDLSKLIIVHDDFNLSNGIAKMKFDGSAGGHKGVLSVINALKDKCFWRMRVGIEDPFNSKNKVEYVLSTIDNEKTFDGIVKASDDLQSFMLGAKSVQ